MKIAILSDIHSNYVALEECIKYALNNGIYTFVFLGDYVGELAYPQKTMDILFSLKQKYNCFFIKVFFASPFWTKLQNIFGHCCMSILDKVAKR